jgi:hypothetical protein
MLLDRGGAQLARIAGAIAHGLDRGRPQRGGVGVEAEDDLATALLDERRQPVSEGEDTPGATAEGLPASLSLSRGLALDGLL